MPERYTIVRTPLGWDVVDSETGDVAVNKRCPLWSLSREDASELAALLSRLEVEAPRPVVRTPVLGPVAAAALGLKIA